MTGYWPKTDIGVAGRPGMLQDWAPIVRNYRGYDVQAISPTFPVNEPPGGWGAGTGQLTVDYYGTSKDFWAIVLKSNPIAIMSFGLAGNDKKWELEGSARNLPQAAWYLDFQNHLPHPGGSSEDFSPYRNDTNFPPITPFFPPDPTQPAFTQRSSNLPSGIFQAIDDAFTDDQIKPVSDSSGDVGKFLCEYMAYHVAWYREYINAKFPNNESKRCRFSGFTHIGSQISVEDARNAVKIQLDVLIDELKK